MGKPNTSGLPIRPHDRQTNRFGYIQGTTAGQGLVWDGTKWGLTGGATNYDHDTLNNLNWDLSGHTAGGVVKEIAGFSAAGAAESWVLGATLSESAGFVGVDESALTHSSIGNDLLWDSSGHTAGGVVKEIAGFSAAGAAESWVLGATLSESVGFLGVDESALTHSSIGNDMAWSGAGHTGANSTLAGWISTGAPATMTLGDGIGMSGTTVSIDHADITTNINWDLSGHTAGGVVKEVAGFSAAGVAESWVLGATLDETAGFVGVNESGLTHSSIGNDLLWADSGHTGPSGAGILLASFDNTGAATQFGLGAGLEDDGLNGIRVDHAAITTNITWATSGHTGTATYLAGFDGSGNPEDVNPTGLAATLDHSALGSGLTWSGSGHTGPSGAGLLFAMFDNLGATTTYGLGAGLEDDGVNGIRVDHNQITQGLDWANTGHTGTANEVAAFNGSGAAYVGHGNTIDASGYLNIPSHLQHSGDTNTYLVFPGADQLDLYAGGVKFFDSNATTGDWAVGSGGSVSYVASSTQLTLDATAVHIDSSTIMEFETGLNGTMTFEDNGVAYITYVGTTGNLTIDPGGTLTLDPTGDLTVSTTDVYFDVNDVFIRSTGGTTWAQFDQSLETLYLDRGRLYVDCEGAGAGYGIYCRNNYGGTTDANATNTYLANTPSGNAYRLLHLDFPNTTSSSSHWIRFDNSSGVQGYIRDTSSSTASGIGLVNASDGRLKRNIRNNPLQGDALRIIRQLQTRTWEWEANGNTAGGWIAQEVYEVYPDAVDKPDPEVYPDGKDDDGNEVMWGLDRMAFIGLHQEALRELDAARARHRQRITDLEAALAAALQRIAALEAA